MTGWPHSEQHHATLLPSACARPGANVELRNVHPMPSSLRTRPNASKWGQVCFHREKIELDPFLPIPRLARFNTAGQGPPYEKHFPARRRAGSSPPYELAHRCLSARQTDERIQTLTSMPHLAIRQSRTHVAASHRLFAFIDSIAAKAPSHGEILSLGASTNARNHLRPQANNGFRRAHKPKASCAMIRQRWRTP